MGAEIDLVLESPGGRWRYAIEVKRSTTRPHPEKGFYSGCDEIGATHRYVVYPGEDRYSNSKNVIITPLADLLDELVREHDGNS